MNYEITIRRSHNLLAYAYGVTLLLIGADKVFGTNIIASWESYVSDLAQSVLPLTAATIVFVLGIAEIVLGIGMFTMRWMQISAKIAIAALVLIIINLLSMGLYDIAARDALIALGFVVLIWLDRALYRSA